MPVMNFSPGAYQDLVMDLGTLFLTSFISLLVITDPFGMVAVFLAITDGDDAAWRRRQALKCGIYVIILLCIFFLAGTYILEFFGFTINAVNIAGGLIIGVIGWQLLFPKDQRKVTKSEHVEAEVKRDVSFVPLTMPIVAGPGAISVVVTLAVRIRNTGDSLSEWLVVGSVIPLIGILTWLCFHFAPALLRLLGSGGLNAISRIMGFIVLCIATEMVIQGGIGVITLNFIDKSDKVTLLLDALEFLS